MMPVLLLLVVAYLLGSIPTSILVCKKLKGIDIRQHGSGNAGATNVFRVMGWKVALFVLLVDACKGAAAVLLFSHIAPETGALGQIGGGLVAILGHIWTVFAKFKGGKGIGPALGVFLALLPLQALMALVVWIILVAVKRMVSVGSIGAGFALFLSTFLLDHFGYAPVPFELTAFTGLIALLIVLTHRKNIGRILNGTENKIFSKRKG